MLFGNVCGHHSALSHENIKHFLNRLILAESRKDITTSKAKCHPFLIATSNIVPYSHCVNKAYIYPWLMYVFFFLLLTFLVKYGVKKGKLLTCARDNFTYTRNYVYT